ncbi:MAG TPA: efflux RND transporter permease subunit, partial [Candidatus Polarisedimenticolaceae bacterium]|nr:efflux RND transporter permease subunit [Candidatus Polarisedimenticolaceae bacterium]
LLALSLNRRFELALISIVVTGVTAAVPMQQVKFTEQQEEERSGFFVGVEMPESTTLDEAEQWFLEAEKIVEGKQDELGLEGWFLFHRKTFGEIQGWFTQPRTVDVSAKQATKIVIDALPKRPGFTFTTGEDREEADEGDLATYVVTLNGEDWDQLGQVTDALEQVLVKVPGVLGSKGAADQANNELALVVDRERAQQLAVNPQVVAGLVSYALRGTPLPKFHKDGKEIPVRVRFREEDRESLSELDSFLVPTDNGGFLPVSALTEAKVLPTKQSIVRRGKRIARSIALELEEGKEDETRTSLNAVIAGVDLPEGVEFGSDRRTEQLNEDLAGLRFAALLSIVFIYLLMGFLFESFVLPMSILFTIPLSAIGVWWIHFVVGYDIDFLGFVAIVLLIGVVVNNGIVLIDYVNRLRDRGIDRHQALLTATDRRFRPIMMTAITTIGGMIPLAFAGANSIGLSYTSFSLTLIGGMTTATLLTLLVVPVLYTVFDDIRQVFVVALARAMARTRGEDDRQTEVVA